MLQENKNNKKGKLHKTKISKSVTIKNTNNTQTHTQNKKKR